MAQSPAVVIVARHGMRLDAADSSWHLSTPTPYDPPLTYGGWNQSRALGLRIASLLHAREQELDSQHHRQHQHADGFADSVFPGSGSRPTRRKRKHRVVIHSSPFLRCLQTSVGIAAGMAEYEPPRESGGSSAAAAGHASHRSGARFRTAAQLYSASSKYRNAEGSAMTPSLASIAEPRPDVVQGRTQNQLQGQRRIQRTTLRVDPFLGEWLNPQYFEHITPPPPSSMMLATARAELMHNEAVDVYTPSLPSSTTQGGLWNANATRAGPSRETTLDDWSTIHEALPAPRPTRRDRANSTSSVGSNESGSGRKSPFRPGHVLQPLTSIIPQHAVQEPATYTPPAPSYAISSSDRIPRGYVSHARRACVNVDTHWDSGRPPQEWGDGGELGEEWSSMHKRFRGGVNALMEWYSQHNADDRGEDALGLDQAESHGEEDEQEDLVVILVTHGAGCNALIGALTNQPVLLDVGMASLTMAVRKDGAPPLLPRRSSSMGPARGSPARGTQASSEPLQAPREPRRRSNLDIGLSAVYSVEVTASTDHLRQSADHAKNTPLGRRESVSQSRRLRRSSRANDHGSESHERADGVRSNTSTALGSIRRPSIPSAYPSRQSSWHSAFPSRQGSVSSIAGGRSEFVSDVMPVFSSSVGLWRPSSERDSPSPAKQIDHQHQDFPIFTPPEDELPRRRIRHNTMLDFSNSPPDSCSPSPRLEAMNSAAAELQHHHHYTSPERHGVDSDDEALPFGETVQKSATEETTTPRGRDTSFSAPRHTLDGTTQQAQTATSCSTALSRNVSLDELAALHMLPQPALQRSPSVVSNFGLWCSSGMSDANGEDLTRSMSEASAAALGDTVARRFDLQRKRRWTAVSHPEDLPTASAAWPDSQVSDLTSTVSTTATFGPSSPPTPPTLGATCQRAQPEASRPPSPPTRRRFIEA